MSEKEHKLLTREFFLPPFARDKLGLTERQAGHTPSTAGTFRKKSGKIPERPRKRSQSVSWNSPREYGWDAPNPTIQGILRFQSISRILFPPCTAGDASFFRSGSGEGLSEPVMELPAVLGVFLTSWASNYVK